MNFDWNFPETGGGSYDGFNDSGIETFTGARFSSLAREVLQNSLDAKAGEEKVTVAFEVVKIPSDSFPGRDALKQIVQDCAQEGVADKKAKSFLERAGQILAARNIPCLQITDYGTTGLRGSPADHSGQWFAITKGRGVNVKQSATAGGSYGIGKNAPFAVSDLHTVFYSTRYMDGDNCVERAQGKSILMSRTLSNGDCTSGTGFYGIPDKCRPMEGDIPHFLKLRDTGTQILVAGFNGGKDWQERIISAVVANFFYAINQGELEVLIQGESGNPRIVEKESLPQLFADEQIAQFDDNVESAKIYYEISKERDNERDMELRRGLGFSRLWTRVGEKLPRRVALLRNTGMLITDDQKRLKRFQGFSDFAAVWVCNNPNGNELLRRMENPRHDAFEPERLNDEVQMGDKALTELAKKVRELIGEFARPQSSGASDIDELSDYLPDRDLDESLPGEGGERDLEGASIYQPKPIKRGPDSLPADDVGEDGDGEDHGDGEGGGNGGGSEGGEGGTRKSVPAKIDNVRVLHTPNDGRKKTVMFTPLESGKMRVFLRIAGDSFTEVLPIAEVHSGGTLAGGGSPSIVVSMEKNKRMSLEVVLREEVEEAITVAASKQKEENDEIRGE